MRKEDKRYIGHVNNPLDLIWIIRAIIKSKSLSINDRQYLKITMAIVILMYLLIMIMVMLGFLLLDSDTP